MRRPHRPRVGVRVREPAGPCSSFTPSDAETLLGEGALCFGGRHGLRLRIPRSARSHSRWVPRRPATAITAAQVQELQHPRQLGARPPPDVSLVAPGRPGARARARAAGRGARAHGARSSGAPIAPSGTPWPSARRLVVAPALAHPRPDQREILDRPDERVPLVELPLLPAAGGRAPPGHIGPSRLHRTRYCGGATAEIGVDLQEAEPAYRVEDAVAEPSRSCARTAILRASSCVTSTPVAALIDFVLSQLPPPPRRVLEVGCGEGEAGACACRARLRRRRDRSRGAGGRRSSDGRRSRRFDEPGPFDAVVASLSLHHVHDLGVALDKLVRLLRGPLILNEHAWDRLEPMTPEWEEEHEGLHGYGSDEGRARRAVRGAVLRMAAVPGRRRGRPGPRASATSAFRASARSGQPVRRAASRWPRLRGSARRRRTGPAGTRRRLPGR